MNIVDGLNKVLSEHYGVPCYFVEFKAEVSFVDFYNWSLQHRHCSYVSFKTSEDVSNKYHILSSETMEFPTGETYYFNEAILVKGSPLCKKLLEVMLEYN